MKYIISILTLFFTFSLLNAQIKYEKGYYINNEGIKKEGYIKNSDWQYNPSSFRFKSSENSDYVKLNKTEIQEFKIYPNKIYRKFEIPIDTSANFSPTKYSRKRLPEYKEDIYLLELLIDGELKLYVYKTEEFKRFFYEIDNELIPLEYKKYTNELGKVYENTAFRQKLKNNFNCNNKLSSKIDKLPYKEKSLVSFFNELAICKNLKSTQLIEYSKPQILITPRANIRSSYLSIRHDNFWDTDLDWQTLPSIGLEFEYVVPFNKNKWSLIAEPTFNYYESDNSGEQERESTAKTVSVRYSSIELPVGFRYSIFLNDKSKIFINPFFSMDYVLVGENSFKRMPTFPSLDLEIGTFIGFGTGIGYKRNRLSIELRAQGLRETFVSYVAWQTSFNTVSAHIGYTIFD